MPTVFIRGGTMEHQERYHEWILRRIREEREAKEKKEKKSEKSEKSWGEGG
jgi:hypothetical protein